MEGRREGRAAQADTLADTSGVLGGFSRCFDLISSEYGWNDRRIGRLRLSRLRQIVAVILERKRYQIRHQEDLAIAQTRMICAYIAATVPVEQGQTNELLESAWTIGERKGEEPAVPKPTQQERVLAHLVPGSYEQAMRMFQPR